MNGLRGVGVAVPLLAVAVAGLVSGVWGYSDGAPEEICNDLIPRHLKPPQNTSCPYFIKLSTYSSPCNPIKYHPVGGNIILNITVTGHQAFKGFVVQARMNDEIVGRFEPAPKYYKMVDCPDHEECMATHVDNSVKDEVVLKWVPPHRVSGKVWFYAAVVRNFDVYWIDIISDPLELTLN